MAVGFILGGSVAKVVTAVITDLVNPFLGLLLGSAQNLKDAAFTIGSAKIMWGDFVSALLDFAVIAAVVYFGVRLLRLDRLDKPKV